MYKKTALHKQRISETLKKNPVRYWLGKKRPAESKRLKGKKRPEISNENNWRWKGNKVSYSGAHHWVKRKLGKPVKCSNLDCVYPRRTKNRQWILSPKRFEWANISGKYLRSLNDYVSLCTSCHTRWDRGVAKIRI